MRKTIAVLTLTAALTGSSAALATTAFAAQPVAQSTTENADKQDSDKTGLLGLLGLAGLAGLLKKKEHDQHSTTRNR